MNKTVLCIAACAALVSAIGACSSDSGATDHHDAGSGGAAGSSGAAGADAGLAGGGGSSGGAGTSSCSTSDPGATAVSCRTPDPADTPQLDGAVFAVSYIYADEQRDKTKDAANVWRTIGFDVDGQSTDASSTNHCMPVAGADAAAVKVDGDGGIDNSFLKNVAPIIAGVDAKWADNWNAGLASGGSTILVYVPDLVLPPAGTAGDPGNATPLPARGYTSVALCPAPADAGAEGGVDGGTDAGVATRQLAVDRASVCDGDLAAPLWSAPDGKLDGDVWDSGIVPSATLVIPFKGRPLAVHLKRVRLGMTLSADRRSVTLGTLSGVADTEELIGQLGLLKGAILPALCGPLSGVFDGYVDRVRKSSDIMSDGSQDPQKTCDGISVGLGFDAQVVQVRGIAQTPPAADTCADQ